MCDPVTLSVVALGATAGAGGFSAYSQYQQGAAENKYYNYLADNSNKQGEYAIKQGDLQSKSIQDVASQESKQLANSQAKLRGSQKTALAASGVSGVTAEDISLDTMSQEDLDKFALRYNADVRSYQAKEQAKMNKYALDTEAEQQRYAGRVAKVTGKRNAFNTLLGTAAAVASLGAGLSGAGAGAAAGGSGAGSFASTAKLSSSALYPCWVAAEVLANGDMMNKEVCNVRYFILNISPAWFRNIYINYGYSFSKIVKDNLIIKYLLFPIFKLFSFIGKSDAKNTSV